MKKRKMITQARGLEGLTITKAVIFDSIDPKLGLVLESPFEDEMVAIVEVEHGYERGDHELVFGSSLNDYDHDPLHHAGLISDQEVEEARKAAYDAWKKKEEERDLMEFARLKAKFEPQKDGEE